MEQWEIDYRKKLENEIPDGAYKIGTDGFIAYTGKGGYINYLVMMREMSMGSRKTDPINTTYENAKEISMDSITEAMEEIRRRSKNKE